MPVAQCWCLLFVKGSTDLGNVKRTMWYDTVAAMPGRSNERRFLLSIGLRHGYTTLSKREPVEYDVTDGGLQQQNPGRRYEATKNVGVECPPC